jgi:uncharacterized protein DUF4260
MEIQMEDGEGPAGATAGGVRYILRVEGFAVFVAALFLFNRLGGEWSLFALLFLVPDLSMLGYLFGRRAGALFYNIGHSYCGPLTLGLGALAVDPGLQMYSLIWLAHIGFDRALGYGLKYASGFGTTHLGHIGKMKSHSVEAAT